MNLVLLTWILLCISIPGFLFCLYRSLRAVIRKDIRALSQVYSLKNDRVEYRVWLSTHIILAGIFLAIILLIFVEQNSLNTAGDQTRFHTRLVLLLQFSALIALVPFLIRLLLSKPQNKPRHVSRDLLDQASQCQTLTQALALLENDYRIESRDTSTDGLTTITLCGIHNSSELLYIEARDEHILKIR